MSKNKKRIGIFGGAFDPPHLGHLISAQCAAEKLGLEKMIFIPCGKHPFKQDNLIASADQRYAMTKLAVAGNPIFDVSDIEVIKTNTTYTVETLEHFYTVYPNDEMFFFIGKDNVKDFSAWKNPHRIMELATVVVLDRIPFIEDVAASFAKQFAFLDSPTIEISSSEIRQRILEGKSVRYLIRNGVELFIDMTGLYRD